MIKICIDFLLQFSCSRHFRIAAGMAVSWMKAVTLLGGSITPSQSQDSTEDVFSSTTANPNAQMLRITISIQPYWPEMAGNDIFWNMGALSVGKFYCIAIHKGCITAICWTIPEPISSGIAVPCVKGCRTNISQDIAACVNCENHLRCMKGYPSYISGNYVWKGLYFKF